MNFRLAAKRIEADMMSGVTMDSRWPTDRPTRHQPPVETDGLDPATEGGPSPYNGDEPLGDKVVTDPLVPVPQKDQGGPMPSVNPGRPIDVDQSVLKNWRQHG